MEKMVSCRFGFFLFGFLCFGSAFAGINVDVVSYENSNHTTVSSVFLRNDVIYFVVNVTDNSTALTGGVLNCSFLDKNSFVPYMGDPVSLSFSLNGSCAYPLGQVPLQCEAHYYGDASYNGTGVLPVSLYDILSFTEFWSNQSVVGSVDGVHLFARVSSPCWSNISNATVSSKLTTPEGFHVVNMSYSSYYGYYYGSLPVSSLGLVGGDSFYAKSTASLSGHIQGVSDSLQFSLLGGGGSVGDFNVTLYYLLTVFANGSSSLVEYTLPVCSNSTDSNFTINERVLFQDLLDSLDNAVDSNEDYLLVIEDCLDTVSRLEGAVSTLNNVVADSKIEASRYSSMYDSLVVSCSANESILRENFKGRVAECEQSLDRMRYNFNVTLFGLEGNQSRDRYELVSGISSERSSLKFKEDIYTAIILVLFFVLTILSVFYLKKVGFDVFGNRIPWHKDQVPAGVKREEYKQVGEEEFRKGFFDKLMGRR